ETCALPLSATTALGSLVLPLVLVGLRFPPRAAFVAPPLAAALREGLGYARRHPVIGPALLLAIAASMFGFPYIIMLPALARGTLALGPSGLALLTACVGGRAGAGRAAALLAGRARAAGQGGAHGGRRARRRADALRGGARRVGDGRAALPARDDAHDLCGVADDDAPARGR